MATRSLEMTAYRLQIPKSTSSTIFEEILKNYSNPERAYHNLSHLYSLFMLAEDYYDFIEKHELIDLSILFHDLIYDPSRKDNEEKSAGRAMELLSPILPPNFLTQINYMILSTTKHSPMLSHHDNKIFLDFDLAILATEDSIYQKYIKAIREEYKMFPDEFYKPARIEVLEKFLKKKHLFFSDFFRKNYEDKAWENISMELDMLK